ncbi:uncharacterized protein LOC144564198 isoform X2 [Carex rostrata]
MHASGCQNLQCEFNDCKKIKRIFTHSTNCKVRIYGGCKMCETLWFLISFHANSCSASNCAVPTCKDWREDLRRIANNSSEPSKSEVLGKLLMDLAIGSEADPSARNEKMNQLVERKSSKGKGSLETGSGSGSGMGGSKGSIARKQQAESVPNKNKVSQKVLLEQLIMGSGSGSGLGSGSGSGSGSGRSARQQRMKQRIAEGSSKGRNQIQNKRFEYTAQDKNIICGLTFLTVYALFRDMMKK